MSRDNSTDAGERTTVRTYIPAHQEEVWKENAEDLDMSLSEFVRSMVQAGRRSFSLEGTNEEPVDRDQLPVEEGVVRLVREREYPNYDALVDALTRDIEDRVATALESLQDEDRLRYNGPQDGFVERDSSE